VHDKNVECRKCGSQYELLYTKTTMRDKDYISCQVCGEKRYSWNEAKIWEAKLVKRIGVENDH